MPTPRRRILRPLSAMLIPALLTGCAGYAADPDARPFRFSTIDRPGDRHEGVKLLGALILPPVVAGGPGASELSGLAWDADDALLYAVSDRGYLVHLAPRFARGRLTAADIVGTFPLHDSDGHPLGSRRGDAEALHIVDGDNGVQGDATLVVAFEAPPRLARYTPHGVFLEEIELPSPIDDPAAYVPGNNDLESVADHPGVGLVTAPQRPLRTALPDRVTLYALDGRSWHYPPIDRAHSHLVDLAATGDGRLIALERVYVHPLLPIVFALRRLTLPPPGAVTDQVLVEEIARFDSTENWAIDNFEGLTRHQGNRWFMVSDDNQSVLQRTALVYFEICDPDCVEEGMTD